MKKQSNNLIVIIACIAVLFVAFFVTSSLTMKGTYSKCVWDSNAHAPVCEEGTTSGSQPVDTSDPSGNDSTWVQHPDYNDYVDLPRTTPKSNPTSSGSACAATAGTPCMRNGVSGTVLPDCSCSASGSGTTNPTSSGSTCAVVGRSCTVNGQSGEYDGNCKCIAHGGGTTSPTSSSSTCAVVGRSCTVNGQSGEYDGNCKCIAHGGGTTSPTSSSSTCAVVGRSCTVNGQSGEYDGNCKCIAHGGGTTNPTSSGGTCAVVGRSCTVNGQSGEYDNKCNCIAHGGSTTTPGSSKPTTSTCPPHSYSGALGCECTAGYSMNSGKCEPAGTVAAKGVNGDYTITLSNGTVVTYYAEDGSYSVEYKDDDGNSIRDNYVGDERISRVSYDEETNSFQVSRATGLSMLQQDITFYKTQSDCEKAGKSCIQVGSSYIVNDPDYLDDLTYVDVAYCEKITGKKCTERIDDGATRAVVDHCDCEKTGDCITPPESGDWTAPAKYTGGGGTPSTPSTPSTPDYTSSNYCWVCSTSGGNKYTITSSLSSAKSLTGGSECSVTNMSACNKTTDDTPVIHTDTYCWACNVNGSYKYTKAEDQKSAATITKGNSCKIVNMSSCTTSTPDVIKNPTVYCWSCDVNGNAKYTKSDDKSEAAQITKGKNCKIVSMDSCSVGKSDVIINPKTGTIAIVIAWLVGILTVGYTFWYFKRSKDLKKND